MFNPLKNNKGLSLVEILISSIIILVVFSALINFLVSSEQSIEEISKSSVANKNIVYIVQSILSRSKAYQFYPEDANGFADSSNLSGITEAKKKTLFEKLAFVTNSKGEVLSVAECPSCNRRMGVSMTPLTSSSVRGLFKVWIVGIEKSYALATKEPANAEGDPSQTVGDAPAGGEIVNAGQDPSAPTEEASSSYKIFLNRKMILPII